MTVENLREMKRVDTSWVKTKPVNDKTELLMKPKLWKQKVCKN